jgi:hypothetical protein
MPADLSVFARMVRFRDRAVALATAYHVRVGLQPSQHYARATFDAIAELIREDERERLAAAGRLQPAGGEPEIECEIDWADVRAVNRPDVQRKRYSWASEDFDRLLALEIRTAAEHFHREPARLRKRTVTTYSDGSTLVGPWQPAPTGDPDPR